MITTNRGGTDEVLILYAKTQKLGYFLLCAACWLGGAWLAVKFLLPWLSPFILAMCIAAIAEPAVVWMVKKRVMPRSGAAAISTILIFGVLISVLVLGVGRGVSELGRFVGKLPEMLDLLSTHAGDWQSRISGFIDSAPDGAGNYLRSALDSISDSLAGLPAMLSGWLLGLATDFAAKLPSHILFIVTSSIGAYFCSATFPAILRFLKRQVPRKWHERATQLYGEIRRTLGKWLKAQLILTCITFFVLLLSFMFLRIEYSLMLALIIAFVDLLPVFGTGTVLIPWAAVTLLTGNQARGIGLAVTYGIASLIRSTVQPKLIGDQLGLHPLVTLMAIYIGYRALGIWGMILFPVAAVLLVQMNEHGVVKLWKN